MPAEIVRKRGLIAVALAVVLACLAVPAPQASAEVIDRFVQFPRNCNSVFGGTTVRLKIKKHFIDHATGVSVSGRGVSARIVRRYTERGVGVLDLSVTTNSRARAGRRTVTLTFALTKDTFTLQVRPRASIRDVDTPTAQDLDPRRSGGFTQATIRITGRNMPTSGHRIAATIRPTSRSPLIKADGTRLTTGAVSLSTRLGSFTSQSGSLTLRSPYAIHSSGPIQLRFTGGNCSGSFGSGQTRTIALNAQGESRNYVASIRTVGSTGPGIINFEITLGQPAEGPEDIYWTVEPTNAFAGTSSTPFNPSVLNRVTVPRGSTIARLTLTTRPCASEDLTRFNAELQTWRYNTATRQAPEFRTHVFQTRCQ